MANSCYPRIFNLVSPLFGEVSNWSYKALCEPNRNVSFSDGFILENKAGNSSVFFNRHEYNEEKNLLPPKLIEGKDLDRLEMIGFGILARLRAVMLLLHLTYHR